MDGYLRLGLLIVAALILFYMLFETRSRKVKKKPKISAMPSKKKMEATLPLTNHYTDTPGRSYLSKNYAEPLAKNYPDPGKNILVISVFAKPAQRFASYDLLQAISATGMQYGEMNIFHYYSEQENKRLPLFSLASATKPGEFKLDQMGDFSCLGLTLFMDIHSVPDPQFSLKMMLKTAEQLADDLDGDLYAAPHLPWKPDVLREYQQRITQF